MMKWVLASLLAFFVTANGGRIRRDSPPVVTAVPTSSVSASQSSVLTTMVSSPKAAEKEQITTEAVVQSSSQDSQPRVQTAVESKPQSPPSTSPAASSEAPLTSPPTTQASQPSSAKFSQPPAQPSSPATTQASTTAKLTIKPKDEEIISIAKDLIQNVKLTPEQEAKKKEYENIDIDSILKNERYVRFQIRCVKKQGPCDKTGRDIKQFLPEVLRNNCAECTPEQATQFRRVLTHLQQRFPKEFQEIVSLYNSR